MICANTKDRAVEGFKACAEQMDFKVHISNV